MKATLARIDAFVIWRVGDAGYDFHRRHTIGLAFGRIERDLIFLEITLAEYREAAAAKIAANAAEWRHEKAEMQRAGTDSLVRQLTDEEVALMEQNARLTAKLFLRIDTLYFVGSRLLDSVGAAADTLLSPPAGRPRRQKELGRHKTVKKHLEERIAVGSAPPAPAGLLALIDDVSTRVKSYRDLHVAHPRQPTFPERRPTLSIGLQRHSLIHDGIPEPKESDDLVALLERYVNTWMDYLETVPLPFQWPAAAE